MSSDKRGGDQHQQQQSSTKNSRPELTAEWTVHAQLTISRPDGSKTGGPDDRPNPVRVVYKWCSDNVKANEDASQSYSQATDSTLKDQHDSFHSTATTDKLPSDSGLSSSSRKLGGGARCKSTCSIVLSAVADFLPSTNEIPEEPDPFYFHTTSTYDIPENQPGDETNATQNFGSKKTLSLRDAFSQTSDTESKALYSPKSYNDSRRRFPYDYRRHTESMLPPPVVEGETYLPSYSTTSSPQIRHPSAQSSEQRQPTSHMGGTARTSSIPKSDAGKRPPRTVHIDVYCTGSDAEDDDEDDGDDGDASSHSSSNNLHELESNSTPQTVLNTEQLLLRHQRVGKTDLPRRLLTHTQPVQPTQQPRYNQNIASIDAAAAATTTTAPTTHVYPEPTISSHLGHALSQSNTADEISESKQILFKKHIGDQRSSKYNFRNRNFRRDQSDDAISSNYPNSSRSTMRDVTCSSISSAMASTSVAFEDIDTTSWKETEPEHEIATVTSLGKSDSFEYDNSIDRFRIHDMDHVWSLPGIESPSGKLNSQQKRIQDFLHSYRNPQPRTYHDPFEHEAMPSHTSDRGSLYNRTTIPERDEPVEPRDEPTVQSHRLTVYPGFSQESTQEHAPDHLAPSKVLFSAEYVKSGSETSTLLSNISGYTNEYLQRAHRFGSVITALRKPGHHIGPSKNPDCQCEHCKRWVAERVQGRGRAYSTGDAPYSRANFWLRRSTPGM